MPNINHSFINETLERLDFSTLVIMVAMIEWTLEPSWITMITVYI